MEYVLVKFKKDYADEFDVTGVMVVSKETWEKELEKFKTAKYPFEKYFGTNEYLEFDSFKDAMRSFKVYDLTQEEYEILKKFFHEYSDIIQFGFIPEPPFQDELYDDIA
jgi:hypothetical protein